MHIGSMEDAKWKGLGLLGIIGFVLLVGAFKVLFSSGVVHLLVPIHRTIVLEVDGQPATAESSGVGGGDGRSGLHLRFEIARGDHRLRLVDSSGSAYEYQVAIKNGFDELVIPLDSNQCFMSLLYTGKAPTVTAWHLDHQPIAISDAIYVGSDSLPATIPGPVQAIEQIACAEATQPK